uniref:Uncharacterized protein n=1 Tax=uncultured bacterium BLR10 TaxID=506513 RepID=C0INT4_9BACT|nr:hypothetical protein AKSOIL_0191 [uncultured bacterium BLR10]
MHGNRGTADYTWDGISRQKLFTNGRWRGMSASFRCGHAYFIGNSVAVNRGRRPYGRGHGV